MRRDTCRIIWAWIALLALLALTCASSWWALGAWNGVVNLGIAALKAAVVALVFMHLRKNAVAPACVGVALFVLLLIFALGGSDYATRDLRPASWEATPAPSTP